MEAYWPGDGDNTEINKSAHADSWAQVFHGDAAMRLKEFVLLLVFLLATSSVMAATPARNAGLPRPTPEQTAWQDLELGLFFHFDISVFPDGDEGAWTRQGHLDPSLYNPAKLDTDQWLQAAKAMGAGYTVFVAKHCTGFISWQSNLHR